MAVSPFPQPTVSANSFLYPAPIFINFDSTTLCQNSTKSDSVLHLLRPLRLSMMYENATRQRLDDVHSINPFMLGAIIISAPVFFLGIPALPTFQRQHYYLCGVGANSIPIPLCILAPGPSCLFLKNQKLKSKSVVFRAICLYPVSLSIPPYRPCSLIVLGPICISSLSLRSLLLGLVALCSLVGLSMIATSPTDGVLLQMANIPIMWIPRTMGPLSLTPNVYERNWSCDVSHKPCLWIQ